MVHVPEITTSVASMAILDIPPPSNAVSDLLTEDLDTSPFERLVARPEEPVGFPLFFILLSWFTSSFLHS